ncbi:MAG: tetratricopeptide repeat protein [Candidatus Brocadiae bacterium]|nr:tetratricopeptide repeat protein [Candidatus Brocadiia bacterium]
MTLGPRLACALTLAALAAGCSSTEKDVPSDPAWGDAEAAYVAGDWSRAIASFQRFLADNPRDPRRFDARLRIGRAHLALGRPAAALPHVEEVIASDGAPSERVAEGHSVRGLIYHQMGLPERAETDFLRALSKGGGQIRRDDCLYFLGVSRIRQGRWDEGIADLNLLLRETPDSAWAPRARGIRGSTSHVFVVQAGAFADAAGARRRADDLRERGIDVELVPDGALTAVRFGRFRTWREAQAEAERVQRECEMETVVIP